jgi:hypothetical protein
MDSRGSKHPCTSDCHHFILERLAQDLEDLARARGLLIQQHEAVVRQRHLPRHGPRVAADQANIGGRMVQA